MGKRGENLFKQNDGVRAIRIAREGGITPGMIEIIAKDGTVFRVWGDNVTAPKDTDTAVAKEWGKAIEELKAKGGKE
jgi:hypothetical protein